MVRLRATGGFDHDAGSTELTLFEEVAKLLRCRLRGASTARPSIEQLFDPNVRSFVARQDGLAVGCGGVAMVEDYAEVKRMYTRPAARGRGVAEALLRRIEDEARKLALCSERIEGQSRSSSQLCQRL